LNTNYFVVFVDSVELRNLVHSERHKQWEEKSFTGIKTTNSNVNEHFSLC